MTMANNNLSVIASQVGKGCDSFELKISIAECHNLFELELAGQQTAATGNNDDGPPSCSAAQYWLSYRCFGKVIQSDLFSITENTSAATKTECSLIPMVQTFRLTRQELTSYFSEKKNTTLRVHLCTEGSVIATAFVDFHPLITCEKEDAVVQNEYSFTPRIKNTNLISPSARVVVALSLGKSCDASFGISTHQQQQTTLHSKSVVVQTTVVRPDPSPAEIKEETNEVRKEAAREETAKEATELKSCDKFDNDDTKCQRETQLLEREAQVQLREEQLSNREKEFRKLQASLEKQRTEWERTKHQEELTIQERLRNKETEMMSIIEERITVNEKERLVSMDKSKKEYEELERRLTKAIVEVEVRDRKLKELQDSNQHEHKRKLAELELREKLIKQEMKHSVEIEQAKVSAAIERATLAEKAAASATKKVKQVEAEMDELRERQRKTPEATLVQKLAEIKGQLADSERRIEAVKAEKNQILQDKEQFRANVKKLAKALRQERDKAVKRKEQSHLSQSVRLSYDGSSRQFVLEGEDQNEVNRILQDLSKLTQKHDDTGSNHPSSSSPFPSPLPSRPLGMDEVLENLSLSFLNEVKHSNS